MVMLQKWSLIWREKGHVIEVASSKEGEWFCYRGGCRGIGHVREVASLMEVQWSCYGDEQFKEGESSFGGGQFNRGRKVMLH